MLIRKRPLTPILLRPRALQLFSSTVLKNEAALSATTTTTKAIIHPKQITRQTTNEDKDIYVLHPGTKELKKPRILRMIKKLLPKDLSKLVKLTDKDRKPSPSKPTRKYLDSRLLKRKISRKNVNYLIRELTNYNYINLDREELLRHKEKVAEISKRVLMPVKCEENLRITRPSLFSLVRYFAGRGEYTLSYKLREVVLIRGAFDLRFYRLFVNYINYEENGDKVLIKMLTKLKKRGLEVDSLFIYRIYAQIGDAENGVVRELYVQTLKDSGVNIKKIFGKEL